MEVNHRQTMNHIYKTRKNEYSQRVQPRTSDTSSKEHIANNSIVIVHVLLVTSYPVMGRR